MNTLLCHSLCAPLWQRKRAINSAIVMRTRGFYGTLRRYRSVVKRCSGSPSARQVAFSIAVFATVAILTRLFAGRQTGVSAEAHSSPVRLLIVSAGGVGSSHIMLRMRHAADQAGIALEMNDVDDREGVKHLLPCRLRELLSGRCKRRSSASETIRSAALAQNCARGMTGPPQAVLYVLGEPAASVRSIFRRRLQRYLLRQLRDHTGCEGGEDIRTMEALAATAHHVDRPPAFASLAAYAQWLARGAAFGNETSSPREDRVVPDPFQAAMREHLCAWASLQHGTGPQRRVAGDAGLAEATGTGRLTSGLLSSPAVAFASVGLLAQQPHLVPQLLHSTCLEHGHGSCGGVLGMQLRVEVRNHTADAAPTTARDPPTPVVTPPHHSLSSTAAPSTPSPAVTDEEWQALRRSYATLAVAVQALDGCTRHGDGSWSAPACASTLQTICEGAAP
jgi:hypothetical protein